MATENIYKLRLVAAVLVLMIAGNWIECWGQQSYPFPGVYSYLNNRPPNDAFVFTQDKRLAITMTRPTSPMNGGLVTSFDVSTGVQLDSEFAGFGPLDIELVHLTDGIRVVALTSRGGPRTVTIYDLSESGVLTLRAETQLTSSSSDEQSNLILSSPRRAGFIRVQNSQNQSELMSFSLDTGGILHRSSLTASNQLNLVENATRSLILTGRHVTLRFIDVTNPAQFVGLGETILPPTGIGNETLEIYTIVSNDANTVFAGGDSARFTAVNADTRQIIGSLPGNYWSLEFELYEAGGTRLVGIRGGNADLNFFTGIILVDATKPANMSVVNQLSFSSSTFFDRDDFAFSRQGDRIAVISDTGFFVYRLPQMIELMNVPLFTLSGYTIATFGERERILGSWGSNNNFSAVVYSFPIKQNSVNNFDLDGKTDPAVFRPSTSTWHWLRSVDSVPASSAALGQASDQLVPADYDGDEKTDPAVFRPETGQWLMLRSSDGIVQTVSFGIGSDTPSVADYDGDGKADIGVFRRYVNRWFVIKSSDGQLIIRKAIPGRAKSVAGDYDGDGKGDFATFASGSWQIQLSTGATLSQNLGAGGDIPVSGDFDNDGKSDLAVYTPTTQTWKIQQSFSGFRQVVFGAPGDIIVPADYDGDGKTDIASYRPSNWTFNIQRSSHPGPPSIQFGSPGDVPIAAQR